MTQYKRVSVKQLIEPSQEHIWVGQTVELNGWVCAIRVQGGGTFGFASVMDNTTVKHMQVVMNIEKCEDKESIVAALDRIKKGAALTIKGRIETCPSGNNTEQKTELIADIVQLYGDIDAAHYPMAKQKIPLETIRQYPHLRFKTKSMVAVNILRNKASALVHKFFQDRDYHWAHTPLLTANDCEGAGETFNIWCNQDEEIMKENMREEILKELGQSDSTSGDSTAGDSTLGDSTLGDSKSEEKTLIEKILEIKKSIESSDSIVKAKKKRTFFTTKVHLTVSGQLHGEAFAHALHSIYTFGPTWRADPSETSRHLAEFWMVEPEVCFITFDELMTLAETFVRYIISGVLSSNIDEIAFLEEAYEKDLIKKLATIAKTDFIRISYSDVIRRLKEDVASYKIRVVDSGMPEKQLKKLAKSAYLITEAPWWGMDLKSEHERYFTDVIYEAPVIIYHYPKSLKPFYMKTSETKYEDGDVVDAMDVLIPHLGELIGGSMREDDYGLLEKAMIKDGVHEELDWYLQLRRYGSLPHGGFGLGFERLVMIITGMSNIKDTIGFPRSTRQCFA